MANLLQTATPATPSQTQVSGLIRKNGSGESPCVHMETMIVKIFQVTLSAETLLVSLVPDEHGLFTGAVAAADSTSLMARLYLAATPVLPETLVAEGGPYCPKNGSMYIEFLYDPAKYSPPLYTWVSASVTPQLGKLKLSDLTPMQLAQLQCISCVSKRTLARLVSADKLYTDLLANMASCTQKMQDALKLKGADTAYLNAAIANIALLSNQGIIESILFALLRDDNSLSLQQVLTTSPVQLTKKILDAVNGNVIPAISNEANIISGFMALRNCMLFNSNYDDNFYDAKLIYLTTLDMTTSSRLLDSTIDAGSLVGVLGNEDSLSTITTTTNSNV